MSLTRWMITRKQWISAKRTQMNSGVAVLMIPNNNNNIY